MNYIKQEVLSHLLSISDLSEDPDHCVSLLVGMIADALKNQYQIEPQIKRGTKVVSVADNYTSLGYQSDEVTLSGRYTKYVSEDAMLRTQMSSAIPSLLREYDGSGNRLWICPGIVYRRDVRDKTHVGEPHQMDVWCLTQDQKTREDLLVLVKTILGVIEKVLSKKLEWRYTETSHNYTDDGIEVEIKHNGQWLEVLECGLIAKELLNNHGLSGYGGLALGMGLERLVMVVKNIDDIRVLRDPRPAIQKQMLNLSKYKKVSSQPATKRDLSVAVDSKLSEEELTEVILSLVPEDLHAIEEIKVLSDTPYSLLPDVAKERLGISEGQKNILLRVVLRDLETSISSENANAIYTKIYKGLHQGTAGYWI